MRVRPWARVVWTFAIAGPLGAQQSTDLRAQSVRPLGSIGTACTVIGLESSGRPDGLFGASSAVELAAGTIFVANIGTGEILQFDRDRRYVGSTMRRGSGPGELSTPRSVYDLRSIVMHRYRGDSLVVFDAAYRRVSILAPSGKFVRDLSLAGSTHVGPRAYLIGSSLSDGGLVFVESLRRPLTSGQPLPAARDSITIVRIGPDGQHVWSVSGVEDAARPIPAVALPTGEQQRSEGQRTLVSPQMPPLQRFGTVVVAGTAVVHYAERHNALVWYGGAGRPVSRVLLPPMPVPTSGGGPAPPSLLTYSDAADRVWLEVPRALQDSPRVWWIVTRDGRLLGSVTTPASQEPVQIGRDFVLLRAQDGDGVQFIRRCGLPTIQ